MRADRGYLSKGQELAARLTPDFVETFNELVARVALHSDAHRAAAALEPKYRELIYLASLATRGLDGGVYNHLRRAMAMGASLAEIVETFEVLVVPGGAPAYLMGMEVLARVLEEDGIVLAQVSELADG